ncbi:RHS repeat-associated core domain-containing protein [Marivirga sericea]|uniref:RHS repeat-associated core domain-containing protein n=1 Tax=Marivirga sericea TaxID=1028 RepID=A0A1X7IA78_9BACT|nr:RHS repeat-associated core domain-containing protein [Marivirga sericea]SMG11512.1 RHS repeat-associated core domain-containing protein [Marivirga sericea]
MKLFDFGESYYLFGMSQHYSYQRELSKKQHYTYNGKASITDLDFGWLDFGARMYQADLGRWFKVDPMAEDRDWLSPYNYVQNNPMIRIDPDGALDAPIYDTAGEFLGTDNEGLQGKAIVMDKDNFTQGMSHQDALTKNKGAEGLNSTEAGSKLVNHYDGLKDRPDYDGVVTPSEGRAWAKSHPNLRANANDDEFKNATANDKLYLDASKMDFGTLSTSEFSGNGDIKNINLFRVFNTYTNDATVRATTYALGRTRIQLINKKTREVRVINGKWNAYD